MKANELREKTSEELEAALIGELKQQFNLRMQQGSGQLSNSSQMKSVRRDIARIKTVITELEKSSG